MKATLTLSILLNVGLVAGIVWLAQTPRSTSDNTKPTAAVTAAPAPSSPDRGTATNSVPSVVPAKAGQSFDWRMVESEDYRKYIANLRAIGCPEETIRDIIIADVEKLFESRRHELTTSTNKFQYWKAGNLFGDALDPERIEKLQALAKEKRALLRELLGVDVDEKPDMFAGANPMASMLDFLPAGRQNEVMEIYMKHQAKLAKSIGSGMMDAEGLKEMQKVQKEMDDELAATLSPQEYEDYQLRMSQTAMMMRIQMASFDPTEQEFRDIFKIRKAVDDEFGLMGMAAGSDAGGMEKYRAAQEEMNQKLKEVLGEQRAAEYERSQDWAYQGIYRVTQRNGLSKDVAVKVYDMKREAEAEAARIRMDQSLSPDQRTEALRGIRTETENAIRTVMGDTPWQSYQGQSSSFWLRGISPNAQ